MNLYNIYYPNSKTNQVKILISHSIYLQYRTEKDDSEKIIKQKKSELAKHTGLYDFFTDKSPLFDAIETGVFKLQWYLSLCYN